MKTAKQILSDCFLGVIDFNEAAALGAMEKYAKQESAELLEALQMVFNLIDKGVLVRDISKDNDYNYFLKQGIEINNAIVLMNEAIKKSKS